MDVYFIRHTEVAVSRQVAYGQTDVDVTDAYSDQLARIQAHLPDKQLLPHPALIFSSPLTRCRRLADDLAASLTGGSAIETAPGQTAVVDAQRPPVQFDDRLKELFFGDWEMMRWTDIDAEQLQAWRADFVRIRMPNGENYNDLVERVKAFWQERVLPLVHEPMNGPLLIVSHGGVIRALLSLCLELPLPNAYRINLDYGAVSKVTLTQSSVTVQYVNR